MAPTKKKLRAVPYRVYYDDQGLYYVHGGRRVRVQRGQLVPKVLFEKKHIARRPRVRKGRTARQQDDQHTKRARILEHALDMQKYIAQGVQQQLQKQEQEQKLKLEKIIMKRKQLSEQIEEALLQNADKAVVDKLRDKLAQYEMKHEKIFQNIGVLSQKRKQVEDAVKGRELDVRIIEPANIEEVSVSSFNAPPRIVFLEKKKAQESESEAVPPDVAEEHEEQEERKGQDIDKTIERIREIAVEAALSPQKESQQRRRIRERFRKVIPARSKRLTDAKADALTVDEAKALLQQTRAQEQNALALKDSSFMQDLREQEDTLVRSLRKRGVTVEKKATLLNEIVQSMKDDERPQVEIEVPEGAVVDEAHLSEEGEGQAGRRGGGVTAAETLRIICTMLPDVDEWDLIYIWSQDQKISPRKSKAIILFLKDEHFTCATWRRDRMEICLFDPLASPSRESKDTIQLRQMAQNVSPQYEVKLKVNRIPWQGQNRGERDDSAWCSYYCICFLHAYCVLNEPFKEASQYSLQDEDLLERLTLDEQRFPYI